jgi:phosphate-selective porin OprO/OprP
MAVPFSLLLIIALLAPVAPAAARDDDDTNKVEVAILDILLERGIIDAATYEELMALAQAESDKASELDLLEDRLRRMQAPEIQASGGKPGKFLVESTDGKWSLGLKGRIQVQYDGVRGGKGNSEADKSSFSVRRARLALFGKAGGENTTYKIEIDAPTNNKVDDDDNKDLSLTDAWVNWGIGEDMNVKGGQFKVPFGREVNMVSSRLNTVDGSITSREFAPDREPGLMFYGATEEKFVEYYAGVFNGEGTGLANDSGVDDTGASEMRWSTRVVFNPLGPVKYDTSAFQTVNDGSTKLALGASFMKNFDQSADGDGDGVVGDASSDDTSYGFEAQLLTGPISVLTEYFTREMDVSGLSDKHDRGYNAQIGVQVVPDKYEVVFRRSTVNRAMDDDILDQTLAFVRYGDKHNSKFTFDISRIKNKTSHNKDEMQYRGQYQVIF